MQQENPTLNEESFALVRFSVADANPKKVGKFFTSKLVELALCSVPGFCFGNALGPAKPRIVHFPALIDKKYLTQSVDVDGKKMEVTEVIPTGKAKRIRKSKIKADFSFENEPTFQTYLGRFFATRSGDKGGNANLGVWGKTPKSYAFLKSYLTSNKLKELLPDTAAFEIKRFDFPNLMGFNFYIIGFLGDGIAANSKMDGQAKSLGEYLRAKVIDVPKSLLES